jgi:hypothetical protein
VRIRIEEGVKIRVPLDSVIMGRKMMIVMTQFMMRLMMGWEKRLRMIDYG